MYDFQFYRCLCDAIFATRISRIYFFIKFFILKLIKFCRYINTQLAKTPMYCGEVLIKFQIFKLDFFLILARYTSRVDLSILTKSYFIVHFVIVQNEDVFVHDSRKTL